MAHNLHVPGAESALGNPSNAGEPIPPPCDDDVPDVHLKAGCNVQQGATSFCRDSLGVQRLPHSVHAATDEASSSCSNAQPIGVSDNQMVVTTSDGQVFAVSMTDAEAQSKQIEAEYRPVELQRAQWISSMSACGVVQLGPVAVGNCKVNNEV